MSGSFIINWLYEYNDFQKTNIIIPMIHAVVWIYIHEVHDIHYNFSKIDQQF